MYGMKPGKRLLTWIMVFVMTLSMLPLNVLASYPVEPAKIIQPDVGTYLTYQFYVGETKVDEQIVKEGETLLAPKTPEAAEGQRFTGWYKGEVKFEGFGTPQGPIPASETIRLDAKFDDVFYVFFVDTNARIVATREGKSGDTITFADVSFPVLSDESITGWYTDEGHTNEVYSVTLENADVTLYAKVEKGHWITFDSDGGSYVAPQFVTKGGSTAQPKDDPTKAGFTFDGWLLDGAAFTFGDALDVDITLTAKWTAKETVSYTVIHWLENADDTEYSYKESVQMSGAAGNQTTASAKTYEGFTAQTITQETIAGDGSTIVNVYYKRNVYKVEFYSVKWVDTGWFSGHYEKGDLLKTITAKHGAYIGDQWPTINGSSTWQTNPSGQPYQVNIETMPLGGATFYGPKTGSGSETAYYYVEVLPGESGGTPVGGKYYKLHHKDTSPGTGYTVSAEDQYPITGYTFNEKISTKLKAKYNNAKFYYDRNGYNVVYVNNGNTVNTQSYPFEASIADAGSYTPPRPEGIDAAYVFTGWYADPAGAQPFVFDGKTMPAQNVTVYAHWAAPVHKVTFKVDSQPDQTIENVSHNATITLPPAPTPPAGEDFLGWVDENGKPFKEDTQITRDLVLTAKFGSKTGYTVTYVTTGGNGTVSDDNRYGKGAAATVLNGADTAPADKVFLYWVDTTGNKYYPNNTITINGDVKLTAVYGETSQPVAITYHSNFDPDKTVLSNNIPNNGLIEILTYTATGLDQREGYTFTGWNTKTGGDGLAFEAGKNARVDSTAPNDLYAQWTVNQYNYTVEYYYDGVLDSTVTDTADYNSVINAYPDKIREGYELEKTEDLPLTVGINEAANVIKVYYVKTTVPYTIHHYLNGTTVSVASDMTGRVAVGETQSAAVATKFLTGYEAAVEYYVPQAVTVTAAMTEVTLTVYYKMPLTIKADDAAKPYDGSPLTCATFTVNGLVNGDQAAGITLSMTADSTITNAGTQANTIDETTVTGIKEYYKVLCQPGTLTITPNTDEITVTITGNNDTKQYNGSEQSVTGFTTDVGSKPITVALKEGKTAIAKGTDVGEYKMGLSEDDFTVASTNYSNIKVKVVDGFLKITPDDSEITVTITGNNDTKQYTGSEQSVTGFTADVGSKPITVALKEGKEAIAKGTNVGKYTMGLTEDDFTVTSANYSNITVVVVDGFLKITQNTDEITVTITGNNDTKQYTGSEQSVTGFTADVGDKPITVALKEGKTAIAKGTNVGEYKMGLTKDDFTVTSANYSNIKVEVVDGFLKITPNTAEITVTITGENAIKQYTGSEQSVTGFTTDVGDKPITVTLKDGKEAIAKGTNVGEYTMGLTADDFTVTSANYSNIKVEVVDGFLEITPNTDEITVTITGKNATKQYTGSEQSVTGFTTDVGDKPITVTLNTAGKDTAKGTNVGEYKMGLTEDDFTVTSANYSNIKVEVVDGFLEITPNTDEITVTITGNNDTKQYTGSEQSVTGFTTDVGDKPITVALKEGKTAIAKGTDVGEYKMNLTKDDFTVTSKNYSNIKVKVVDGFLEITPNTDEITVTITGNNDTKQYNGSEQSVTGFTADVGDKPITVALKEGKEATAKGTDVGEYKMNLTADDFTVTSANYSNIKVKVVDGFLKITPNDSEITVTITGNNDTKQYTGSEQSVTGFTADVGDKPITVALKEGKEATAKGTNVGEYKMNLTKDDFTVTSANYSNITVVVVDGFLKITPDDSVEINVKIVGKNDSRTYTGLMQKVEGFTYTVDVKGTDVTVALKDGKKAVAEGLSAGIYHMGLTKEFFDVTSKNYSNIKVEVVDGFLVINYTPYVPPTVKIEDDDALGLNTTDHFAYIIGYPDGTVQPNGQITRAEVATIFFRLLTEDVRTANLSRSNRYFDVAASEWYNTAVSTLSSMGIITGYPDGTFRPNAYITRAEFAAIAARFDPSGDKTTASFRDILNHWAKDEISIAYNNSWVDGYPDGTFGPQRNITRAETMTLVNRVLNRRPETEEDLLPEMTIWTDNANPNAWYYLAVQEATNSHYYKFKTNSKYEKWTELRENRDWTQLEK